MRLREVLAVLEQVAPVRYAFSFDKVGLQVGDPEAEVSRVIVSLDRSRSAVAFAREQGAQLLLAHHPLLFSPLREVVASDHVGRTVLDLAAANIAFVAAHTNWDSARGGVNDALAERLGLRETKPFGFAAEVEQLKLVFFAPSDAVDRLIDALSEVGAGVIGAYRRCAFLSDGNGTYIGGEGTDPTVGEPGKIEVTDERRVEMVLRRDQKRIVERTLRENHPYEEPAYDLLLSPPVPEQPAGRIGVVEGTTLAAFAAQIETILTTRAWAWGDPQKKIRKVAVVGGAADGEWIAAQRAGADVLVTGEVKQHVALEAAESGFALVAAGHYATEQPGVAALRDRMAVRCPQIDWRLFTPEPGRAGRPL